LLKLARSGAALVQMPRIKGEQVVLVDGYGERLAVTVKDLLGAVAVVHIPVDDRDPAQTEDGSRPCEGHPDVGEDAESHSGIRPRMMSRRPDQRIGVGDRAVQDRGQRRCGAAGGQ